jgi:hypothetical protein
MSFLTMCMRPKAVHCLLASCFLLVGCAGGEPETAEREVLLLGQPDGDPATMSTIAAEQRKLFSSLVAGQGIEQQVTPDFSIRDDHSATPSDSGYDAQRRQLALLRTLNARTQWADSVVERANLADYFDFQIHELSGHQIVVLAHNDIGSTVMTSWVRGGSEWRAAGMVMNPSPEAIALLRERSSQQVGRPTQD